MGDREGALSATREAVAHDRALSSSRPEAFLPDLAGSVGALSHILAPAEVAFAESLQILQPFHQRHPQAFAQLHALSSEHLQSCQVAQFPPNPQLLA